MYTAFSEAVDLKLSTYNFQTDGFTKLSDKRLRRIRRFVGDRTKLDVAMHQVLAIYTLTKMLSKLRYSVRR